MSFTFKLFVYMMFLHLVIGIFEYSNMAIQNESISNPAKLALHSNSSTKRNLTSVSSEFSHKKLNTTTVRKALSEIGRPLDDKKYDSSPILSHGENNEDTEQVIVNLVEDKLLKCSHELISDIIKNETNDTKPSTNSKCFDERPLTKLADSLTHGYGRNAPEKLAIDSTTSRTAVSGRFFLFKGLKKIMWTVFVGLQIVKTVLLALFLPSILGSLGKMVGKGISSVSGFNHPSETVNDLDFRDDTLSTEQDNRYDGYAYQQPEASNNKLVTHVYDSTDTYTNPLSRFGASDQKLMHINPALYSSKHANSEVMSTKNNFENFLDIPASSLLLTNYDPFYSPLLSRLDAVFQQLGLQRGNEVCRMKLVCFMYSNPAKYAPYSNLVSAQLSRELNELRKPTIDNPDILRFFKYMKAAKDGQDGVDCQSAYYQCNELKQTENPVMLNTYYDINKLVQARKLR